MGLSPSYQADTGDFRFPEGGPPNTLLWKHRSLGGGFLSPVDIRWKVPIHLLHFG